MENGLMSAQETTSMHPLWSELVKKSFIYQHDLILLRYVFPPESVDGIIDLSADEKTFYFNPYSGELSLQFPKVETKCRGGILA